RSREVELRLPHLDAELRERLLGLLDRERRLHPRLGRDAPDPQARSAELRLLLDADGPGAELGRPDRRGVPAGPAAEDGNVTVHIASLLAFEGRSYRLAAHEPGAHRPDAIAPQRPHAPPGAAAAPAGEAVPARGVARQPDGARERERVRARARAREPARRARDASLS